MAVDVTPNQAFLPAGSTLFAYLTGRCHTANISALRVQAEALVATRGAPINVLLFVDTPATIGKRGREATTQFVDDMTGKMTALVLVVDANTFWRSMIRSAVSAGLLRSKKDYPVAIVGEAGDALAVFAKAGVTIDLAQAESVRTALRVASHSAAEAARARGDTAFVVPGKDA